MENNCSKGRLLFESPATALRRLMEGSLVTEELLCAHLECSPVYAGGLLNGTVPISRQTSSELAELFDVDADFFFTLSDSFEKEKQGDFSGRYASFGREVSDEEFRPVDTYVYMIGEEIASRCLSPDVSGPVRLEAVACIINAYEEAANAQLPEGIRFDLEWNDLEREDYVPDDMFDDVASDWLCIGSADRSSWTAEAVENILVKTPEEFHSFYNRRSFDTIYSKLHEDLGRALGVEKEADCI